MAGGVNRELNLISVELGTTRIQSQMRKRRCAQAAGAGGSLKFLYFRRVHHYCIGWVHYETLCGGLPGMGACQGSSVVLGQEPGTGAARIPLPS